MMNFHPLLKNIQSNMHSEAKHVHPPEDTLVTVVPEVPRYSGTISVIEQ